MRLVSRQVEISDTMQTSAWLHVFLLSAARVAVSGGMAVDTTCLGTGEDVNDETFLSEPVGNKTKHLINEGERAFRYELCNVLYTYVDKRSERICVCLYLVST